MHCLCQVAGQITFPNEIKAFTPMLAPASAMGSAANCQDVTAIAVSNPPLPLIPSLFPLFTSFGHPPPFPPCFGARGRG